MAGLVPPERLAFYNRYGQEIILSAVAGISDSVLELDRHECSLGLRQEIADTLTKAWLDSAKLLESTKPEDTAALRTISFEVTALICNRISDETGEAVVDSAGVAVLQDVQRALMNLGEALTRIYRDTYIDLTGKSPD
jgi:hypothetical protein